MQLNFDVAEAKARFHHDGVICLPNVLSSEVLACAQECYEWTFAHPGPSAGSVLLGTQGTFYQDQANPAAFEHYHQLIHETSIPDITRLLFSGENVWFLYEQIWLKEGADTRRTPWHQDLPYLPCGGDDLSVMWMPLDPVAKPQALEFVRGSHRGPLYNPSAFNPDDELAGLYDPAEWPPLPDIQAARGQFDIISWATNPGDVVIFHPAILHGGAPTQKAARRRTVSLRFFGDDACFTKRPHDGIAAVDGLDYAQMNHPLNKVCVLTDGAPFRHPEFPHLRPSVR